MVELTDRQTSRSLLRGYIPCTISSRKSPESQSFVRFVEWICIFDEFFYKFVLSPCIYIPIYPFLSFVSSLALSRSFGCYHNAHVGPADYNVVHFLIIIIPLFDMENPVGLKIDAFIRCSSSFIRNRFTNTKISWTIVRAE